MTVTLLSFGHKHRLPPLQADKVVDVRDLRNPFWFKEDGRNPAIIKDVLAEAKARELVHDLVMWVTRQRSDVTVAIGCYGGRHRSVALTETMAQRLTSAGYTVHIEHLELAAKQSA